MINVADILNSKGSNAVFTISETATLSELVNEFYTRKIGALIATNSTGDPVGIVSERDVMRPCSEKADFDTWRVSDIMTKKLITVQADDDVNIAMDQMIAKKIRHLPVMSNTGFQGIITVRDLLHAMREADKGDVQALVEYLQNAVDDHVPAPAAT